MSEDKGKWGYLVVTTVVTGVIGYFLPKALDAVLPRLSENPLSQYPMETVGIAVAASLIGFFAGNRFGKTRVRKPRKLTQEEMKAENDRVAEENKKIAMRFPIEFKGMLKCAVENGAVYCRTDDWNGLYGDELRSYENFFIPENVEGSRTRLTPSGTLTKLHEYADAVFDVVSDDTMIRHAVYDPSESKPYAVHSSGDRFDWWWYSHDPEKDYHTQFKQGATVPNGRPGMHNVFDSADAEDELKFKMMKGFSKQKARAILNAFKADGYVEIGDFENEVTASIQRNEGIFLREAWRAYGMSVAGKNYCITNEWRALLRDSSTLAKLKELAESE